MLVGGIAVGVGILTVHKQLQEIKEKNSQELEKNINNMFESGEESEAFGIIEYVANEFNGLKLFDYKNSKETLLIEINKNFQERV